MSFRNVVLVGLLAVVSSWMVWQGVGNSDEPKKPVRAKVDHRGVKKFGAVGDGKTDDTAAIQRAVDAKIGDIKFPPGVYRITKPIVVDLDRVGYTSVTGRGTARILMAGSGPALKFIGTHGGTADPGSVKQNVWDRQRMPIVNGLEIVGDHQEAVGIEAQGTMKITISQVTIRRCLHAIHLTVRNRNVLITDCHLYHNRGIGVYLDKLNLHQINITDSHISYNDGGGVVCRGGNVRNIQIGSCDIEGNMSPETPATANVLLDCTGGSVAEVAIVGCTIQHNHKSPESANVRMIGHSTLNRGGKTQKVNWGHLTIANNVMSDVRTNIDLVGVRDVTIVGNTLWQGFDHNILIRESSHVVIGANVLDRNPPYGYAGPAANRVVLRDCRDCTIDGLHVRNVLDSPAGVVLENCRRMNVTNSTILDCDGAGLLLKNVTDSRVSDCLIHDERTDSKAALSLRVVGGRGNMIVDNLLKDGSDIPTGTAHAAGNYEGQ